MVGFDGKGQKMKTLVNGVLNTNNREIVWDGRVDPGKSVSNGLYFYRIHLGNFNQTKIIIN